jgi:hypothetical protein
MTSKPTSKPLLAAATFLPLLVVCACSFRGSVTDAQRSSTAADASASTSTTESTTASSGAGGPASTASASATTGPAGGTSSTATPTTAGGVHRCHTSELTGHLVTGGAAAGQRYATLVLTDTGGQSCTVHGYGGLGLVDAAGHALPTHQIRDASPAPTTALLTPGRTVSSQLHWGAVPGPGDAQTGDCQPTAAALRVIPPDETDYLTVRWNLGPVCERGTIDQRAYAR